MKLHAYTKSELAQLYCPDADPHIATNRLSRWIARNDKLKAALKAAGYRTHTRCLTAQQVRIIVAHLGEPD